MANCSLSSELASWMASRPGYIAFHSRTSYVLGAATLLGWPRRAIGVLYPSLVVYFKVLSPLWLWRGAFFFYKTDPDSSKLREEFLDNPDLETLQYAVSLNSPCWHLLQAAPALVKHALHEERVRPMSDWVQSARMRQALFSCADWLVADHLEKGHDF